MLRKLVTWSLWAIAVLFVVFGVIASPTDIQIGISLDMALIALMVSAIVRQGDRE